MKILVADDHQLVREGLHYVLRHLSEEDLVLIDAQDAAETLAQADCNPDLDLILLDLAMPGAEGFDTLVELRRHHPAVPVVVLSASDRPDFIQEALRLGASGFVPKSASSQEMLNALRLVFSGGVYVPPEDLSGSLPRTWQESVPEGSNEPDLGALLGLTQRQIQVLALMVQGKPNKVICYELGISEGTVKIHVTAILKALGVTSRTQAVVAVNRLGIKLDCLLAAALRGDPELHQEG